METEHKTRKRSDTTNSRIAVLENNLNILNHNLEKLEYQTDQNYATLHSRISDLRDDLRNDFESKNDKLFQKLQEHNDNSTEQNRALHDRISHIEKWRWMIMGGALVVGYVIAHVRLDVLFS